MLYQLQVLQGKFLNILLLCLRLQSTFFLVLEQSSVVDGSLVENLLGTVE